MLAIGHPRIRIADRAAASHEDPTLSASLIEIPGRVPVQVPPATYDLKELGYLEQEFVLEGSAESYGLVGDRSPDGRWTVQAAGQAQFFTRLLVRRPADEARFSGTVLVEWLNVSGGLDAAPDWMYTHTHLIRRGHAWVGVSAQRAGISGGGIVEGVSLKKAHPVRYAQLEHPGDQWSYDIYSQAARALRDADGPLAALSRGDPLRLLGSGHSQSAAFLVTYLNAVDQLAQEYDGFLIRGRGGSGASLDSGFHPGAPRRAGGERIRDDLRVPVIVLQTETDVALLGGGRAAQPDARLLRNWELAGAAHGDTYLFFASTHDDGYLDPQRLAEMMKPTASLPIGETGSVINSGPQHHYVACAAVECLNTWAGGGPSAPTAPRLNLAETGREFVRNPLGIATGGIRTPWTDVPVATLSGTGQSGGGVFAFLFGTTRALAPADIAQLYPGGQSDYRAKFEQSLDAAIAAGFLLSDDRAEILAISHFGWPG